MNRWFLWYILTLADWTSGLREGVYDPNRDYEPMDEIFETHHRGSLELPPCVKDLMNCWEVMNPDRVCKIDKQTNYIVAMDTICMDLRFQCREYMGYSVFPNDRNITDLFRYCHRAKTHFVKPEYWSFKKIYNVSGNNN